jgi:hypothetical protein
VAIFVGLKVQRRKMVNLRRNLVSLFLILAINISVAGKIRAENDFFDVYDLSVEGDQVDYLVDDLNNDGLNDCLFFHTKKDKIISRHFSIFYQTVNGFSNKADQSFKVDADAIIFDIADVNTKSGKEIVFFKSTGVFYYERELRHYNQTPKILLKTNSIFKLPDKIFLEYLDFARDLNDDGIDEIMVPQFNNYAIYCKDRNGDYGLESMLNVRMQNSIISSKEVSRYLVSSFVTPNIIIADYNRDQKDDIIIIQDTYLKVFFQDKQGNYSNNNSKYVELGFEIAQAYSLRLRNINPDQRNRLKDRVGIRCLRDINGDGLLDIVIEKLILGGGVLNPKKQVHVFFGKEAPGDSLESGIFNKVPDHIISNPGFQVRSWVVDLNNDKKLDIMVPAIQIGLFNIISMLITGNINVTSFVYLMDDAGRYPEEPDDVLNFTVEFDRTGRKLPVGNFDGDYNGDGRMDLLGADGDNLEIRYSAEDGKINEDTDVRFPIEIPNNGRKVKPRKINADAKSDVVIIYPRIQDENTIRENNVCILISK